MARKINIQHLEDNFLCTITGNFFTEYEAMRALQKAGIESPSGADLEEFFLEMDASDENMLYLPSQRLSELFDAYDDTYWQKRVTQGPLWSTYFFTKYFYHSENAIQAGPVTQSPLSRGGFFNAKIVASNN